MKSPPLASRSLTKIEPVDDDLNSPVGPNVAVSTSASGSGENTFSSSLVSNPFATRFVSPGQVAWIGESDYFEQLASRWKSLNCRASIVGVHGAGKSTLLEHFVPLISQVVWRRDAEGRNISRGLNNKSLGSELGNNSKGDLVQSVWLQLRKTAAQSMVLPWDELTPGRLLIIDGYEQLPCWRRLLVIVRARLKNVKLLVTSHRRTMLPALCNLSVSSTTARQIVLQLTTSRGVFATISDEEIRKRLRAHRGNMRETLMDYYDQFEESRAADAGKVNSKS